MSDALREKYVAFLPAQMRPDPGLLPESSWWDWRDCQVHIERVLRPESPFRMLFLHGAGTHAAAMWPVAGAAASRGIEVLTPDLPGYGHTRTPKPGLVRYEDWVSCAVDLALAERAADPRPLVLFGASMGGMLAYEVAARSGVISAVAVTCLMDPRDRAIRAAAARYGWMGLLGPFALTAAAPVTDRLRLPIRFLGDVRKIGNDPELVRLCAGDRFGGGNRVPLGFLRSWMTSAPSVEPEDFTACPILLAHPAADRWIAPELSLRFFDRIAGEKQLLMLENAGHYPIETPGVQQLGDALEQLRQDLQQT
jgi:alpha-beta hydrolase superfamily lysophospholipase